MTTITGSGNYASLWGLFQGTFVVAAFSPTSFTINSFYSVTFNGSGFTYNQVSVPGGGTGYVLTGGTITSINASVNNILNQGQQTFTGLNVSAAAAFQAIPNEAAFNALFFGGDDTFTYTGTPIGSLNGYGGNDTFYISDWGPKSGQGSFEIDGGSGSDTINITGGARNNGSVTAFNVRNIETVNLGTGYDYEIAANDSLVTSGNTLTIDGSTLGAANHLTFRVDSATNSTTPTGNLVLYGGAGNDFFQPGKGSNSFNGGAGTDTVDFESAYNETGRLSYSGSGVTVNLNIAGFQSLGGLRGGSASFNSIENLIGTQWADTLIGDSSDNVLDAGNSSGDTLIGGAGNDTLIHGTTVDAGAGDDTIIGGTTIDGGSGTDTVVLDINWNIPPYLTITRSGSTVSINGAALTNVEYVKFINKTVSLIAPTLSTSDLASSRNQTWSASNLFTAVDYSGSAITDYQLWDSNDDPLSGHFTINGVVQTARTIINITAAQLVQTSFVTGQIGDTIQIRAFDGVWSAPDNGAWAPFTISVPNVVPVLTTAPVTAAHGQTFALSGLATVIDGDGDAMTKYQLWDGNDDPLSGHFEINGVAQAARNVIEITAAQVVQTSFVTGKVSDILQVRAFDGAAWSAPDNGAWSPFTVSVPNAVPVVTTAPVAALHGQSFALSGLVTVNDSDGDTITKYQLWDSNDDPLSGHFAINGVAQAARNVIEITAAQAAQTTFVAGVVNDTLQIRATDGIGWSAPDNGAWSPFTVTVPVNHAPVAATAPVAALHGQTIALSSLMTVSDADSDPITKYQLWDASDDAGSGYFVINGVIQAERTVVNLTPSQVAQTSFVAGIAANDTLHIRAFDGFAWSAPDNGAWSPFTVTVPVNHAPVMATVNKNASHNQSFSLSSLITVNDSDNDPITKYQLWDGTADPLSGHFVINGVAQSERSIIDITAAQLAQTSFVAGLGVADTLQIRAYDGAVWSAPDNGAWSPFTVSEPPNHAPVVSTSTMVVQRNQTLALSSLFSATDADGDPIVKYWLWDASDDSNSGSFAINGVTQAARTIIEITAAQVAQVSFVTGTVSDLLHIRAYDGQAWSAPENASWASFMLIPPFNHAPVVATANKSASHSQSYALSSLMTVSDADSDTITKYQLWDVTDDAGSGYFVINGVAQTARTVLEITAAQVAQTSFVAGIGASDTIHIRAFDGFAWSAPDNGAWSPFAVTVPANHAPVVATAPMAASHGQTIALSSLITVSDADSDPIIKYQLWDGVADPSSGHFVINGVVQAERNILEITASQVAQTSFVTGIFSDTLQIRAYDGGAWSAPDNGAWSPFAVTVPANHAPVLTTSDLTRTHNQSQTLSSLITVNDADGDSITAYQLWDATAGGGSGHFEIGSVAQAERTVIDITAAQLAQTTFVTGNLGSGGDTLQIRAFDGFAWSAPDNGAWAPFHINVS